MVCKPSTLNPKPLTLFFSLRVVTSTKEGREEAWESDALVLSASVPALQRRVSQSQTLNLKPLTLNPKHLISQVIHRCRVVLSPGIHRRKSACCTQAC